jgi:hypothetical protein
MKNQDIKADLAKVAAEYNHSVLQQALLENYREPLLLLRAKYASYETIVKVLAEHGVKASVGTIRKFCITNDAEIKRLREESEDQRESDADELSRPSPETRTTNEPRAPLTSEPGKRGPRVARDQL